MWYDEPAVSLGLSNEQAAKLLASLKALDDETLGCLVEVRDRLQADVDAAYDPEHGDDKVCTCGHPYHRHFDSYDQMRPVGCKYCSHTECEGFTLAT